MRTIHRTILFYNKLTEMCELQSIGFNNENYIKVNISYDIDQRTCFLFIENRGEIIYLYVDKRGRLVSHPFKKAMFFNLDVKDIIGFQFSISYVNGQYFTATPSGEFKLGPNEAKNWELLQIDRAS